MQELDKLTWIILFAFSAMVFNTIGIWVVFRNVVWAERSKEYFMCFACTTKPTPAIEFAEGLITFSVLVNAGLKEKNAFYFAFLVAALTIPIGAFIAYPFVSGLSSVLD